MIGYVANYVFWSKATLSLSEYLCVFACDLTVIWDLKPPAGLVYNYVVSKCVTLRTIEILYSEICPAKCNQRKQILSDLKLKLSSNTTFHKDPFTFISGRWWNCYYNVELRIINYCMNSVVKSKLMLSTCLQPSPPDMHMYVFTGCELCLNPKVHPFSCSVCLLPVLCSWKTVEE